MKIGAKKSLYRSKGIAGNSACLKNSYTEVTINLNHSEKGNIKFSFRMVRCQSHVILLYQRRIFGRKCKIDPYSRLLAFYYKSSA